MGELVGQPVSLIPTEEWLSINTIGYDYDMARRIAAEVGTVREFRNIAGRDIGGAMGDEGTVNTLPRLIMQGFLACHLGFGRQDIDEDMWRKRYAEL